MTRDELIEAIRRDAAAMSSAAARDLDARVPSCPDWDVRELIAHLGRIHRWVAGILRSAATERPAFPPRPEVVDTAWFDEGVGPLLAAIEETDPDQPTWNFASSAPQTARFWARRQACETTVHRWDAEAAFGEAAPVETELALTGIDEVLDLFLAGRKVDLGGIVHLHATDTPHGEWLARIDAEDGFVVGHGHEQGDVALRATASDLYLWLWGRPVPADRFEIVGDEAILDRWGEQLRFG